MLFFNNQKKYKHFLYLTPAIFILTIFIFYPLIKTFIISFSVDYNKFSDSFNGFNFGFKNYKKVFQDPYFVQSLTNTLLLVFISVPLSMIISLVIALFLNSVYNKILKEFLKTIFFLPFLMNKVIMGIVFSFLFYHSYGFFNKPDGLIDVFLNKILKIEGGWLNPSSSWNRKFFVLICYIIWTSLPFKIFIFTVGLQNIDKNYYKAAKIDGASRLKILFKITIPLLSPVFFYQLIVSILQTFKEYDSVVGLFGENNSSVQTMTFYIYKQLQNHHLDSYAKGSAASIILFFISAIFTLISFYFFKKKMK
ncbi:carbohydrate ABC transporter permease [Candidatus Phytoplasma prunorum]|uniref:carbohydrate ABC transporter permease n=1 Tax=Candidatus Phytoplasma prunorum TaxID=47565 RepID=UPI002FEEC35B